MGIVNVTDDADDTAEADAPLDFAAYRQKKLGAKG
jgi:hypothetical protein